MNDYIKRWREAHQHIDIVDEGALAPMAPFPSLYANDFIAYIGTIPEIPEEVSRFVKDISREMVWVYDNWAQTQAVSSASSVMTSMLNEARSVANGGDYTMVQKFILDYAAAHNIRLLPSPERAAPWMQALSQDGAIAE